MKRPLGTLFAIAAAMTVPSSRVAAQAFTAPQGLGSVTVAWQYVDNTGHRFSDGFLVKRGQSVTMSAFFEADYGVTDRLSATVGIPYVLAKYTGTLPPFSGLPVDACACWHSSFQDISLAARYRFGNDTQAITPVVRYVHPSHNYRYAGEAVVGRRLDETQVGIYAGMKLHGFLSKASVQTGYTYAFVEKPIPDISINRSNGFFDIGYALTSRLYVHGVGMWQETHGGLRIGSPTGNPFFPPGELAPPELFAQRDRLLSTQYWHAGGGAAYSLGRADIFVSIEKYVSGKNTHNGQAYTIGSTWYFDRSKL
jgi:hypothetical protein